MASLTRYLQQQICKRFDAQCQEAAFNLLLANYLDIDYDSSSQALSLSAYWEKEPLEGKWNDKIEKHPNGRIEVGILNAEFARDREDMKLGGWLAVIGEDTKPSKGDITSQYTV